MIKDQLIQDVLFQRLQPLAIAKYWGLIQQCLVESLEGQTAAPGFLNRLMAAVQSGEIQVWSALSNEQRPVLAAMIFTRMGEDDLLGTKSLWIYGLVIKAHATPETYAKCLSQLEHYAKENKCCAVRAQTDKSGVKRLLESNGWKTGSSFLIKEI